MPPRPTLLHFTSSSGQETADPDTDTDIRMEAQTMFGNEYGCPPVTEGQHLVGVLTEADCVRFLATGHRAGAFSRILR